MLALCYILLYSYGSNSSRIPGWYTHSFVDCWKTLKKVLLTYENVNPDLFMVNQEKGIILIRTQEKWPNNVFSKGRLASWILIDPQQERKNNAYFIPMSCATYGMVALQSIQPQCYMPNLHAHTGRITHPMYMSSPIAWPSLLKCINPIQKSFLMTSPRILRHTNITSPHWGLVF